MPARLCVSMVLFLVVICMFLYTQIRNGMAGKLSLWDMLMCGTMALLVFHVALFVVYTYVVGSSTPTCSLTVVHVIEAFVFVFVCHEYSTKEDPTKIPSPRIWLAGVLLMVLLTFRNILGGLFDDPLLREQQFRKLYFRAFVIAFALVLYLLGYAHLAEFCRGSDEPARALPRRCWRFVLKWFYPLSASLLFATMFVYIRWAEPKPYAMLLSIWRQTGG